jgi:TonB family protein
MIRFLIIGMLLSSSELAAEWFPVKIESLSYPLLAMQARISGEVRLKVSLTDSGEVASTTVVSGNALLARSAQANIKLWRFLAVRTDSSPLIRDIEFVYDFELTDDIGAAPNQHFQYVRPNRVTVMSIARRWTP